MLFTPEAFEEASQRRRRKRQKRQRKVWRQSMQGVAAARGVYIKALANGASKEEAEQAYRDHIARMAGPPVEIRPVVNRTRRAADDAADAVARARAVTAASSAVTATTPAPVAAAAPAVATDPAVAPAEAPAEASVAPVHAPASAHPRSTKAKTARKGRKTVIRQAPGPDPDDEFTDPAVM